MHPSQMAQPGVLRRPASGSAYLTYTRRVTEGLGASAHDPGCVKTFRRVVRAQDNSKSKPFTNEKFARGGRFLEFPLSPQHDLARSVLPRERFSPLAESGRAASEHQGLASRPSALAGSTACEQPGVGLRYRVGVDTRSAHRPPTGAKAGGAKPAKTEPRCRV